MNIPKGYRLVPVETLKFALGLTCHGFKNRTDQESDKYAALKTITELLESPMPAQPAKVVITDESGTKAVFVDWCEKCDGVTAHETRCVQCSVKPQPIYDETKERELFESVFPMPEKTIWDGDDKVYYSGLYEDEGGQDFQRKWEGWKACAQSRAKYVEVDHE